MTQRTRHVFLELDGKKIHSEINFKKWKTNVNVSFQDLMEHFCRSNHQRISGKYFGILKSNHQSVASCTTGQSHEQNITIELGELPSGFIIFSISQLDHLTVQLRLLRFAIFCY